MAVGRFCWLGLFCADLVVIRWSLLCMTGLFVGGLVCGLDFCVTSLNGVSLIAYVVALRCELLVWCISKVFLFGVDC